MILNLNVGVLGHVDSGKTSITKVLSQEASTAAFDKNPQSKERGITLDLGFSALTVDLPDHLKDKIDCTKLQYTLVDCPGHASLIKTIIGGAQIIDFMLLVIDVTKGMQTQTAECLIIGEITCKKMIVVLNKIDLLESSKQSAIIEKITKKINITLKNTLFKNSPIVSVSALSSEKSMGLDILLSAMNDFAFIPVRNSTLPFLFAVDHCFGIKGQGTVVTGTILQGAIAVNDSLEIPSLKITKKVKSMQMFKKPISAATQGDRLGICVTQFDPKLLERGIVCSPGYVPFINAAVIDVHRVKYFRGKVLSKSKYHITMGHETVMATLTFFGLKDNKNLDFNFDNDYLYQKELIETNSSEGLLDYPDKQFALLEFERPVLAAPHCLVIGSKFDVDIHTNACRLAFYGTLQTTIEQKNYQINGTPLLKVYKNKIKTGFIDRLVNDNEIIAKNLFKKESNLQIFIGLSVFLSTGEKGRIESGFGQSGKARIYFSGGLKTSTLETFVNKTKNSEKIEVNLQFKRYIYDVNKKIIQ